jgi:hypothetical protein
MKLSEFLLEIDCTENQFYKILELAQISYWQERWSVKEISILMEETDFYLHLDGNFHLILYNKSKEDIINAVNKYRDLTVFV